MGHRDRAGRSDVLDDEGNPTGETDEVNPIPEGNRAMISENPDAKFGQLAAADLAGYEASVRVLLGQIMAVSALPAHYVGVFTDNPASRRRAPRFRGIADRPRRGPSGHVRPVVGGRRPARRRRP